MNLFYKRYIIITTLFICFILAGCAPTKIVIQPLRYNNDIGFHISKAAHIHWAPGKRVSSERPTNYMQSSSSGDGGLAGLAVNLIFAAADNHQRKNHPSEYVNEYGKADEAVFMTSLRDILTQQNVFKKVELTTDLNKVSSEDVLIKINFKTARVVNVNDIKLTVKLSIKTGHHSLYERTYLVQNDPQEISKAKTFVDRKTNVSQKLLTVVIDGIKQWHEENK